MMDRIDHGGAAFFAAATLFWAAGSLATKWFPALLVFWTQGTDGKVQAQPERKLLQLLFFVFWGLSFAAYASHFHWAIADTYRTLVWLAVFIAVAVFGLLVASLWAWSLGRIKLTRGQRF